MAGFMSTLKNAYHKLQALLAVYRFRHPARHLTMIGVTGTDGKTTTTHLIEAVLHAGDRKTGIITTVSARIAGEEINTGLHVTTPDPFSVQSLLQTMRTAGVTHAVVEATSHGLAQHRVYGCEFDVAVITNITNEHLDYHKTYEQYRKDKGLLFSGLRHATKKSGIGKLAILNKDDSSYTYLRSISPDTVLTYSLVGDADVVAKNIVVTRDGTRCSICYNDTQYELLLPLLGVFNIANALAAFCVGLSQNIPIKTCIEGLEHVAGIPGRMQNINQGQTFTAFVDFAHTPNALEKALTLLRQLIDTEGKGKLIVVFGCAGERDPYKRDQMGAIAGRLADRVVITSEDPRDEDPDAIIATIEKGVLQTGKVNGKDYWCIPDRKEAIAFAVGLANKDDILDITGKGHEQSLCIHGVEYPWDDREVLKNILRG